MALTINDVKVKERHEFSSILTVKGEVNGFPYEADYDLREGRYVDGTVTINGKQLPYEEAEPVLIEIGTLLDETENALMVEEMSRICGE